MKRIELLNVLLLVGCGAPSPFAPKGQCQAPGWGAIFTEDARPCSCIAQHAQLAKDMLVQAGITEDLSGATVWLRASETPFEDSDGLYEARTQDIVLTRLGDAWVHEALHHVQRLRGEAIGHTTWSSTTWMDPNFGERSLWDLTALYWEKVQPADGGEGCS